MSNRKEVQKFNDFLALLLPGLNVRGSVTDKDARRYDYVAYMLDRTQQMFVYNRLPETIPAREFELLLQVNGFAGIAKASGKLYAFFGGLGGVPDEYYRPTEFIVNNPALKFAANLKIDDDCVIIRNDDMYAGLMPMFSKYAELLAENDITFRTASINGRLASIISAGDTRTAEAAKKYLADIEDGKLGVIAESAFLDGVRVQPAGERVRGTIIDWIEYHQYLKASWFNDLGIEANYNMKREALNSNEVKLNIKALLPLAENMLNCRKEGVEKVNAMFGTNITVDFASVWEDTQEELDETNQTTGEPEEPEQEENENENSETD